MTACIFTEKAHSRQVRTCPLWALLLFQFCKDFFRAHSVCQEFFQDSLSFCLLCFLGGFLIFFRFLCFELAYFFLRGLQSCTFSFQLCLSMQCLHRKQPLMPAYSSHILALCNRPHPQNISTAPLLHQVLYFLLNSLLDFVCG